MVATKAAVVEGKAEIQIPEGRSVSGRPWKTKQTYRSSIQQRSGVLQHLNKSFEVKQNIRAKRDNVKELERQMKTEAKQKRDTEKARREEKKKLRMANEYKSAVYQVLKPEKIKGMSKKQLRSVKKTSMNKNGQVELINPWTNSA